VVSRLIRDYPSTAYLVTDAYDIHYRSITARIAMAGFLIDFEWFRDSKGYRVVPAYDGFRARIIGNGGRRVAYRPLEKTDLLYALFARVKTLADLLDFVGKFGPLTADAFPDFYWPQRRGPDGRLDGPPEDRGYGEYIDSDLKRADWFRRCLQHSNSPKRLRSFLGERYALDMAMSADLVIDRKSGASFRFTSHNLAGAMQLQLAQKLTGEANFRACLNCGEWFEVGPGTRRRLDAKFCTDAHRILFNSLKRSK
jgi:hypothetical protein